MKLKNIIEEFLKAQNDETRATYKKKIYVFGEYLVEKKNATDANFVSILKGMEIKDFMESLEFYVKNNNISFESSAELYFSTVRSFYMHISDKYENCYIGNKAYASELNKEYKATVKALKLNSAVQVKPLENIQARILLDKCNEVLKNFGYEELVSGKHNGVFSRCLSAIIIKLVLYFGISNKTIRELKLSDIDLQHSRITINGYSVHLPDILRDNLDGYINIRKYMLKDIEKNQRLFIDFFNPTKEKLDNTKMFFLLKEVFGFNSATAVAKYAIIQLIERGTPENLIKEFTGYKDDIYKHCQEIVNEKNTIVSKESKCKLIDSKLRMTELSDII